MEVKDVAPALQERLGTQATKDLLELLGTARQEWTADVTTGAVERFERRLTEEISNVRVALAQSEGALRHEIASLRTEMREGDAALRVEMSALGASLRHEMGALGVALRQETSDLGVSLRQEMSTLGAVLRQEQYAGRFELLKWSFVFWIGQVIAVAGVMGLMLRLTRA